MRSKTGSGGRVAAEFVGLSLRMVIEEEALSLVFFLEEML